MLIVKTNSVEKTLTMSFRPLARLRALAANREAGLTRPTPS
jgi:hypothetical protein